MTKQEIINQIEESLELDENTLKEETVLDDIVEYDSMGKLSLIVLSDEEFEKKLTGEQMEEFKTVGDIIKFLEA